MDKSKLIRLVLFLAAIAVILGSLLRLAQNNSLSLAEYERQNLADNSLAESLPPKDTVPESPAVENTPATSMTEILQNAGDNVSSSAEASPDSALLLPGASLNGDSQLSERVSYTDDFYYEPISDSLRRYITGISYPAENAGIRLEELCYLHILHYNFDGNPAEGELICNRAIAQDLVEIFYELYRNEYQLEQVLLIEEFEGDDTASMAANNTSCFNYRSVPNTTRLSKHALGLAIDINPLYNPYINFGDDGTEHISPDNAAAYADRSSVFPYKIDESDLCYKLFTEYGFTWGGNWNNSKDYQHFQKVLP